MTVDRRRFLGHCSAWFAGVSVLRAFPAAAEVSRKTVLVLGDSLSAEYGLARGSGWVALLEQRLLAQHVGVVNASVSGETTSGGRSRLPELLGRHHPTHLILELGGNDALRGLPLAMSQANLRAMATAAKAAGAKVVLVGMQVPPNYGRRYADDFAALYASVAKEQGAALVPFLLKGVADSPRSESLFQADRIHPNAQAQTTMLDNVWAVLGPMLR